MQASTNHKKRVADDDYFVVNPLDIVDCIDTAASGVKLNPIDDSVLRVKQLVLKESAIPPKLKVFRLGNWLDRVVIRRELADRMKAAGFTGLNFFEPAEYEGAV